MGVALPVAYVPALGEAWLKLTAYGLTPKDSGFAKAESALHRALEMDARHPPHIAGSPS
jgi:hypothetical protein